MAKVGLALLSVVVIAVGGALYYLDAIARSAIETGTEAALGCETRLDSVSIGLVSGQLGLSGLAVANPPGFGGEHFLVLREGHAAIDLSQVTAGRVAISDFVLEGVELDLEYVNGKSNFREILRHLEGSSGRSAKPPAQESGASAPQVELDLVQIKDVTARLQVGALGRSRSVILQVSELRVPIPKSRGDTAVTTAEIVGHVVRGVLQAVFAQGADLPAEVRAQLAATVGGVRKMGVIDLGVSKRQLEEQGRRGVDGLRRLFERREDD